MVELLEEGLVSQPTKSNLLEIVVDLIHDNSSEKAVHGLICQIHLFLPHQISINLSSFLPIDSVDPLNESQPEDNTNLTPDTDTPFNTEQSNSDHVILVFDTESPASPDTDCQSQTWPADPHSPPTKCSLTSTPIKKPINIIKDVQIQCSHKMVATNTEQSEMEVQTTTTIIKSGQSNQSKLSNTQRSTNDIPIPYNSHNFQT